MNKEEKTKFVKEIGYIIDRLDEIKTEPYIKLAIDALRRANIYLTGKKENYNSICDNCLKKLNCDSDDKDLVLYCPRYERNM